MTEVFIISDPDKCTGCGICEFACSAKKEKKFNPLLSRIRLVKDEPLITMSLSCRLCEKPTCVAVCPTKALKKSENTGVIMVEEDKCIGCRWCLQACPFGALGIHPTKKSVFVCDLCEGDPFCIKLCPKEALELMTQETMEEKARISTVKKLLQSISST
jgi:Fe-S-cluster-containing dehydrogenase component